MKERLVGAAVLVAIGVWLIPWVLDGPEEPLETGASTLQLPAAEEPMPMRTQTLRLGAEAETEPEPEPEIAPPPVVATPVEAPPAAEPSDAAPAEVEVAVASPSPEAAPPPAQPAARAPAPAAAAPRPATAAPPPKPAPAVAARGDWAVQLGSFGEEARARSVVQRAGTFGYKAAVTTVRSNGRTLYRVRVGPYAARAEATAAASALVAHGIQDARVVAAE